MTLPGVGMSLLVVLRDGGGRREKEARRGTPGAWIPRHSQAPLGHLKECRQRDGRGCVSPTLPLVRTRTDKRKAGWRMGVGGNPLPRPPSVAERLPDALTHNPTLTLGIWDTGRSPTLLAHHRGLKLRWHISERQRVEFLSKYLRGTTTDSWWHTF